jgi:hypothetical protein
MNLEDFEIIDILFESKWREKHCLSEDVCYLFF